MNYRIVPCGGVTMCSAVGCSYVTSTREHRHCSSHPDSLLVSSGECPVEFVYVYGQLMTLIKEDGSLALSGKET